MKLNLQPETSGFAETTTSGLFNENETYVRYDNLSGWHPIYGETYKSYPRLIMQNSNHQVELNPKYVYDKLSQITDGIPIGTIIMYPIFKAPADVYQLSGFLYCNGACVSKTTYGALFNLIRISIWRGR